MDLHRQHLRPAQGKDFDLRNDARADAVADEVGQSLLQVERVAHAADVAAAGGSGHEADDVEPSDQPSGSEKGATPRVGFARVRGPTGLSSLAIPLALGLDAPGASAQEQPTLYTRIGGYDVIARVVDDFLQRFDGDAQLAPFLGGINAAAGARIRQHFVDFICARTGGPCLYNGRDMKAAHEGLTITPAQFDAVIRHFSAAIEARNVAPPARQELLTLLRSLAGDIVTR